MAGSVPRYRPMSTAPKEGLLPPRLWLKFRGLAEPVNCYWHSGLHGWVDDSDPRWLKVMHNPEGWLPAEDKNPVQLPLPRGARRPRRKVSIQQPVVDKRR